MAESLGKRVVLIRNAFFHDFGGAERYPINLADELVRLGYTPIIISRFNKLLDVARARGHKTIRGWWWSRQNWSGSRTALIPIYILWQIVLTIFYMVIFIRLRPDIIHPMSKDDFIAATLAGRMLSKKVIWTDHADLKYVFANQRVWYKNPIGKLVFFSSKLASKVTIASHNELSEIETVLSHKLDGRYKVVYNGVADTKVAPKPRKIKKRNAFIFCATSRLVDAKGIGELIEAFKKVHAVQPDTLLWLIGDGPDTEKFKIMAKEIDEIGFMGYSDEALNYVAAADVFVHPSYHEAFSLSLIEAAMLGKPIIAGKTGGNPEIVKDGGNGFLVPVKNVGALAEAMLKLLANEKLVKKMGNTSRRVYEDNFIFSNIVKREIIPIYEEK